MGGSLLAFSFNSLAAIFWKSGNFVTIFKRQPHKKTTLQSSGQNAFRTYMTVAGSSAMMFSSCVPCDSQGEGNIRHPSRSRTVGKLQCCSAPTVYVSPCQGSACRAGLEKEQSVSIFQPTHDICYLKHYININYTSVITVMIKTKAGFSHIICSTISLISLYTPTVFLS